ncbi:MAG TPA: biotin--[acetyl-CoA-carboxylase] ligase [Tepidisphaeraceae bacterium]
MNDNAFNLDALHKSLHPFRLHFFTRLRSTNDHAARMRRDKRLYAPAVVVAGSQSAGRGRGSNVWWSGRGSLTVTFVLPIDPEVPPHRVPLLAGLAVRRAVCAAGGPAAADVRLKWPNDLWHRDLKFAGLLCERVDGVDLVGLGLNVNLGIDDIPSSLRPHVTSLSAFTGRTFPLGGVLAAVGEQVRALLLDRAYGSYAAVLREYESVHALHGRDVVVDEPGTPGPVTGRCVGLDAEGRLRLRVGGAERSITAGSVRLA